MSDISKQFVLDIYARERARTRGELASEAADLAGCMTRLYGRMTNDEFVPGGLDSADYKGRRVDDLIRQLRQIDEAIERLRMVEVI